MSIITAGDKSDMFDKVTGVTLKDGRQIVGTFGGFDSDGNILLTRAVLKKPYKSVVDGAEGTLTRVLLTIMIPFGEITGFYQGAFQYESPPNSNN